MNAAAAFDFCNCMVRTLVCVYLCCSLVYGEEGGKVTVMTTFTTRFIRGEKDLLLCLNGERKGSFNR